jgi:hypothetical protein
VAVEDVVDVTTFAPMTASHIHRQGCDHASARSGNTSSTTLLGDQRRSLTGARTAPLTAYKLLRKRA